MNLLWFFEVEESLGGFFPHLVKGQGEPDIDFVENYHVPLLPPGLPVVQQHLLFVEVHGVFVGQQVTLGNLN